LLIRKTATISRRVRRFKQGRALSAVIGRRQGWRVPLAACRTESLRRAPPGCPGQAETPSAAKRARAFPRLPPHRRPRLPVCGAVTHARPSAKAATFPRCSPKITLSLTPPACDVNRLLNQRLSREYLVSPPHRRSMSGGRDGSWSVQRRAPVARGRLCVSIPTLF
jgi:hypothetical protein